MRRRRRECHRRCDPTPGLRREQPGHRCPSGWAGVQVPDASITARASTRCSPSVVGVADDERRRVAAAGRHLVEALPRDRRHGRAKLEIGRDFGQRGERRQICWTISPPVGQRVGIGRLPSRPHRAGGALPHRCCSAMAKRRAHVPIREAMRRRCRRARRSRAAIRARPDARRRQDRPGRRRSPRREALRCGSSCISSFLPEFRIKGPKKITPPSLSAPTRARRPKSAQHSSER